MFLDLCFLKQGACARTSVMLGMSCQRRPKEEAFVYEIRCIMTSVSEINDIRELDEFRPLWRSLLKQTENASFIQSLEWLEVYWKHFSAEQKLRVLLILKDGETIGIVPLVVRNEPTQVGQLRHLTYPLAGRGPFYGPIGGHRTIALGAALQHVRKTRRDWDVLKLRPVRGEDADIKSTETALRKSGLRSQRQQEGQSAIVELSTTYKRYWSSRPRPVRLECQLYESRLEERGEVTYVRHRPERETRSDGELGWNLFEMCGELERHSSKSSIGRQQRFWHDVHQTAWRLGATDLNLLLLDGKPIAFAYNFNYRGYVNVVRSGFDPTAGCPNAGIVLLRRWIADSFQRRDRFIDLGSSHIDSRWHWETSSLASYCYTHFPISSPRAQLMQLNGWAREKFKQVSNRESVIASNVSHASTDRNKWTIRTGSVEQR